jgi:hypothetical protein
VSHCRLRDFVSEEDQGDDAFEEEAFADLRKDWKQDREGTRGSASEVRNGEEARSDGMRSFEMNME